MLVIGKYDIVWALIPGTGGVWGYHIMDLDDKCRVGKPFVGDKSFQLAKAEVEALIAGCDQWLAPWPSGDDKPSLRVVEGAKQ